MTEDLDIQRADRKHVHTIRYLNLLLRPFFIPDLLKFKIRIIIIYYIFILKSHI